MLQRQARPLRGCPFPSGQRLKFIIPSRHKSPGHVLVSHRDSLTWPIAFNRDLIQKEGIHMRLVLWLVTLVVFFESSMVLADVECRVRKVLDHGRFENEYDFSFSESPFVSYISASEEGQTLSIGELAFAEKDQYQPSDFSVSQTENSLSITVVPQESGEEYTVIITLNGKARTNARLEVLTDGSKTPVAELSCRLL